MNPRFAGQGHVPAAGTDRARTAHSARRAPCFFPISGVQWLYQTPARPCGPAQGPFLPFPGKKEVKLLRIRYIPADPAGNRTAFVLTPVAPELRAALAARMMALCPEGFEQVGFTCPESLLAPLPRLDMMGGEFCGNASRAFALLAAARRGRGETELAISVSGAKGPVHVRLDPARGTAYAHMPLPTALETVCARGQTIPVVRMEGIAHAIVTDNAPSADAAQAVLHAMPLSDAQGVLFVKGAHVTPLVHVPATGTSVWESSCGSGSVALAWYLARKRADGEHAFSFDEPGGRLSVRVLMRGGNAVRAVMGGSVTLGEEREITL